MDCVWRHKCEVKIGRCADELGMYRNSPDMTGGFYLTQTARNRRRSSGTSVEKFADELGVCRDSRPVTSGMCLNADERHLAGLRWAPDGGVAQMTGEVR
jgi:hypothetical protein